MKNPVWYATVIVLLAGAIFYYLWNRNVSSENIVPEDALVRAEDIAGTDFYVRYEETSGTDFLELPTNEKHVSTKDILLVGDYNKEEDREFVLSSMITRYIDDAATYFDLYKEVISNQTRYWHNEVEFTPSFNGSSYFPYRQCIKGIKSDNKKAYMCVISKKVSKNYLFVLHLWGSGTITNEALESIIGAALVDKQVVLEKLP